jgi:hypothetical protein
MTSDFTGLPMPRYVSKGSWLYGARPVLHALVWGKRRRPLLMADKYFPFVWTKIHFDKTNTDGLLAPAGVKTPRAVDYYARLLEAQAQRLKLGGPR